MYSDVQLNKVETWTRKIITHYNHEKYWKYRQKVVTPGCGTKIGNIARLLYIKRADAYNNASMGTHLNYGATFAVPPQLPHGLNGIIVSHNAAIGKNVRIFHQVTIGEGKGGAPVIGNDVIIGAGSKLIGKIIIGNNVSIAAGCTVMQDIPDNSTVFPGDITIKIKKGNNNGSKDINNYGNL